MESIFGRKKARPRQSSVSGQDLNERSVPYDKLSASGRSPIAVGTVNQGIRGISAPNTNPALTVSGTELNKFTMQKNKAERERLYEQHQRRESSSASVSTADSSTLIEEHGVGIPGSSSKLHSQQTARMRRSEASSSGNTDFGLFANAPGSPITRPNSGMTMRSDNNRNSRYAASLTSSDGGTHHSHLSQFYHRHHSTDTFHFPRPDTDEEIETLFQNVKRSRDLGDMLDLHIDQKWHIVYNDEHIRWKEEKQWEEQSRKQNETGQPAAIMPESPEWYIKKFLDKTITPKQAGSLLVSLRSKELR